MTPLVLARLRRLCLALPESREVEAWGEPTFRVRNRLFAMYAAAGNHHGNGRAAVWCTAAAGTQPARIPGWATAGSASEASCWTEAGLAGSALPK